MEGKSFFLQEVQIVREMLEAGKECWRFFLLDELFKGTNTVERIAIAKAVLSALAHKNSIVFASTHDVELASLLEDEYELFHFCECVADNTLSFDYKLKPGPVTERNAIRLSAGSGQGSISAFRGGCPIILLLVFTGWVVCYTSFLIPSERGCNDSRTEWHSVPE